MKSKLNPIISLNKPVSIPYRYSMKIIGSLIEFKGKLVSIPYRYSMKTKTETETEIKEASFNPL